MVAGTKPPIGRFASAPDEATGMRGNGGTVVSANEALLRNHGAGNPGAGRTLRYHETQFFMNHGEAA